MFLLHVALTVVLAVFRIAGEKSLAYQGIAHVVVGGYFGAGLVETPRRRAYLALALGLTMVEVVCFVVGRIR